MTRRCFQFGEVKGEQVGWYRVDNRCYAVSVDRCECQGAAAGLMCKHLSVWADKTGQLDRLIPSAYARIFAPETTVCPECRGDGCARMYTGGHFSDYWTFDCHACGGIGCVPLAPVEPAPEPLSVA